MCNFLPFWTFAPVNIIKVNNFGKNSLGGGLWETVTSSALQTAPLYDAKCPRKMSARFVGIFSMRVVSFKQLVCNR